MNLTKNNSDKVNRKKTAPDMSTMIYGKVPPQARELEEAILGAIMLERNAFDRAIEVLQSEMFYVDAHQRIFKAMVSLSRKSQPIDILTVTEELRSMEELDLVGGPYYVTKLTNAVVSSANIEAHCHIIRDRFNKREVIRLAGELISDAYEDSVEPEDLTGTINELSQVFSTGNSATLRHIDHITVDVIRDIEDSKNRTEDIIGISSGYMLLDKATSGWQDGELIILAARPSVGKTAKALNLGRNAIRYLLQSKRKRKGVGLFSLEMKGKQQVRRMLAAESKMYLKSIKNGKLEEHQMQYLYQKGIQSLAGIPFYIDDRSGLTLLQLQAQARRMVNKFNCGLIIIDYLQLISSLNEGKRNMSREQEISTISRGLKNLAGELNVPIIALSQLSREIEKRNHGNKIAEPQLSDLRDSGSIEQDADMVMFLYKNLASPYNSEFKERIIIKIAKQRDGELEKIEFEFNKAIQFFTEIGIYTPPAEGEQQQSNDEDFPGKGNKRRKVVGTPNGRKFVDPNEGSRLFIQTGSTFNGNDPEEEEDPFPTNY